MTALPEFALSIRQPWAWAVLNAGKDIENRVWQDRFRGPVAIHTGKAMTAAEVAEFSEFLGGLRLDGKVPRSLSGPHYSSLPRGGIVGVAEIVDCVSSSSSPWFFGPYGFVLRNARPVPFIPCRGALGFFRWEASPDA